MKNRCIFQRSFCSFFLFFISCSLALAPSFDFHLSMTWYRSVIYKVRVFCEFVFFLFEPFIWKLFKYKFDKTERNVSKIVSFSRKLVHLFQFKIWLKLSIELFCDVHLKHFVMFTWNQAWSTHIFNSIEIPTRLQQIYWYLNFRWTVNNSINFFS